MNTEQKRYALVFTGLFLMILGGFIYMKTYKKSAKEIKKAEIRAYIKANKEDKSENIFVPFARPTKVNFVYDDVVEFKRSIPLSAGLKKYAGDRHLSRSKLLCNGKNCRKQVLTSKNTSVVRCKKPSSRVKVISGNVLFTKGHLEYLKSDIRIEGDLYIKDISFVKIPKNFHVIGNIYLINSEALSFAGNNFIDGHIFVSGKSSVKAFPKTLKMTGQIFI
ncbi:MAG: hypothetical protein IJ638_00960 [Alphaproteobacteria bacterium]|nr:hypothetical protein [Alphaproteobacteria bacterium]